MKFIYLGLVISASAIAFRPIEGTVPWSAKIEKPTWSNPDWPVGYKVPDFGVDKDIIDARQNIASTEKKLKKTMKASFEATKDPLVPRNYKVPDFGVDKDIIDARAAIKGAEKKLNFKFHADFKLTDGVARNYAVADFGVDSDIQTSLANSKKWNPKKDEDGKYIVPAGSIEFKL